VKPKPALQAAGDFKCRREIRRQKQIIDWFYVRVSDSPCSWRIVRKQGGDHDLISRTMKKMVALKHKCLLNILWVFRFVEA